MTGFFVLEQKQWYVATSLNSDGRGVLIKKPTVKSTVIAVLLGGALYGLCANAHIDFFPCTKTTSTLNASYTDWDINTHSGTCSILGVNREPQYNNGKITENEELNAGGYVVSGFVFGLFPIGVGLFFGGAAAKEEEAAQTGAPTDGDEPGA